MEENKIDCSKCRYRYAKLTGELNCGIKQSIWTKGRMCLAESKAAGMYWIHEHDLRRKK